MVSNTGRSFTGLLDLLENGSGYLRSPRVGYRATAEDVTIPSGLCRRLGLRGGELIEGSVAHAQERHRLGIMELQEVRAINGRSVAQWLQPIPFEELAPAGPARPLRLATEGGPLAARVLDLLIPLGFGSRGVIAAAPRTGKTILLQQIAHAVAANHPAAELTVLLIDERPEEVTEVRRNVPAEVAASANDRDAGCHVHLARLILERAKRLVESGKDVVILVDSLTRLARAHHALFSSNDGAASGECDPQALSAVRDFLATARETEEGGSLTILGTVLVGTGSRMDESIARGLEGAGDVKIVLSRELADRHLWPAIDVPASGAKCERPLLDGRALQASRFLRSQMNGRTPGEALEWLRKELG